jgi:hypothetical protein
LGGYSDFKEGVIQTQVLPPNGTIFGRYVSSDFVADSVTTLYVSGQGFNSSIKPPEVFFKYCAKENYDDCKLTDAERVNGTGMIKVGKPYAYQAEDGIQT